MKEGTGEAGVVLWGRGEGGGGGGVAGCEVFH